MNKTDLHKIVKEELNSILGEKKTDYSKRRSGVKPKGNDYFKRRKKLKEGSTQYTDWDENKNPDSITVHLKNGQKLEISKKNIPNGSKAYNAILQAFIDDRFDITDKVVAAMISAKK